SNGTSAFRIQNAGGTNMFSSDTTNERIYIGPTAGDSVGALLVLGLKTNSSADPTGVTGAMYYNNVTGSFRCYDVDHWENCLQEARNTYHYDNDMMTAQVDGTTTNLNSGTGSDFNDNVFHGTASHPGVVEYQTGTTTNGYASAGSSNSGGQNILLGAG